MNLITFLQAAGSAAGATAQQGSWSMWIMLILIIVVMWFFMIRPQRNKKGDKVVTIGGIYGTVVDVKEKTLLLEIDNNVRIKVDKNSVVKDFSEAQPQ